MKKYTALVEGMSLEERIQRLGIRRNEYAVVQHHAKLQDTHSICSRMGRKADADGQGQHLDTDAWLYDDYGVRPSSKSRMRPYAAAEWKGTGGNTPPLYSKSDTPQILYQLARFIDIATHYRNGRPAFMFWYDVSSDCDHVFEKHETWCMRNAFVIALNVPARRALRLLPYTEPCPKHWNWTDFKCVELGDFEKAIATETWKNKTWWYNKETEDMEQGLIVERAGEPILALNDALLKYYEVLAACKEIARRIESSE